MSGLSREDRTTLSRFSTGDAGTSRVGRAVARALALIDQQEKALGAADELERAAATFRCNLPPTGDGPDADRGDALLDAELAYRSARATSTKEDG